MAIPDIGGILNIEVRATGLNTNIICKSLKDAEDKLQEWIKTDPASQFKYTAIYSPFPFSINSDE